MVIFHAQAVLVVSGFFCPPPPPPYNIYAFICPVWPHVSACVSGIATLEAQLRCCIHVGILVHTLYCGIGDLEIFRLHCPGCLVGIPGLWEIFSSILGIFFGSCQNFSLLLLLLRYSCCSSDGSLFVLALLST